MQAVKVYIYDYNTVTQTYGKKDAEYFIQPGITPHGFI
jgi:hypothetical protein